MGIMSVTYGCSISKRNDEPRSKNAGSIFELGNSSEKVKIHGEE